MELVSRAASKKLKSSLSSLELVEPTVIKRLLPAEGLRQIVQDIGLTYRTRVFTPVATVWLWLKQRLKPGTGCRQVVAQAFARGLVEGHDPVSTDCSAYCRARGRLPEELVERANTQVAQQVDDASHYQAFGRPAYVVDGTTAKAADTEENQEEYPQPTSQKPGCGFPSIRIVGVFSLATGVLRHLDMGPLAKSELALFYTLWSKLPENAILIGDRYFGCFMNIALLLARGIDTIMRVNAGRKVDFRQCHTRLGKGDALFEWTRPSVCPWLSKRLRLSAPKTMLVRVIRYTIRMPGFRSEKVLLATTLLDPKAYPAHEIAQIYGRRWQVELDIRDIKTTLGMEFINVQSPAMVRKEIWMHMLGYNLARSIMQQACALTDLPVEEASFKGSLSIITAMADTLGTRQLTPEMYERMLRGIAQARLRRRPNRSEPRAIKRRKKDYPMLTRKRCAKSRTPKVFVA